MSKPYPSNPFLEDNYGPVWTESIAYDLPVIGEIPAGLSGSLYRNGPNPQFAPRGDYHWFAGDGMVHAFHVKDGKVSYVNKWVHTPKWQREHEAGESLFGPFGNPMTSDPNVIGLDAGVANTNIVWFNNQLMALEEAHQPFLMDSGTLESKEYFDFNGTGQGRFTAHPKVDPETGEMHFFAYSAGGPFSPDIDYGVLAADGELIRYDRFKAPYSAMIHDFVLTENYVIFPVLPLTGSMERVLASEAAYMWEPEAGVHVGILRRGAPIEDMRWFTSDPCYVFHFMNGYEEDDRLFVDGMQHDEAPLFPRADGKPRKGDDGKGGQLHRWTFDLADESNVFTSAPLGEYYGDFPRIDERFTGLEYRHGFFASRSDPARIGTGTFDCLGHLNHETGGCVYYQLPEGDLISEPVFVARSPDAAEGDGWIVAVAYRGAEKRSDLLVFDTADITSGPVACAQMSSRVPFGFHGNWRSNPK